MNETKETTKLNIEVSEKSDEEIIDSICEEIITRVDMLKDLCLSKIVTKPDKFLARSGCIKWAGEIIEDVTKYSEGIKEVIKDIGGKNNGVNEIN